MFMLGFYEAYGGIGVTWVDYFGACVLGAFWWDH